MLSILIVRSCSIKYEEIVCQGMVDTMMMELLPMVQSGVLSTERVCSEYLYICKDIEVNDKNLEGYVKNRLAKKPEIIDNNDYIDTLYDTISNDLDRPTVRSV